MGLHNEVYQPHEYTAGLTQALHNLAKTEDPDRYTVAVNGFGHAEHAVNQNTDIQGMNRYFGWYEKKLQDIEPWVKGLEEKYPWQKLMLTEYGADANLEHQTEYLGDALNWGKPFIRKHSRLKRMNINGVLFRNILISLLLIYGICLILLCRCGVGVVYLLVT